MKKVILFIMGMLCGAMSLYAQSPPEIKPLTIGDTVPDIVFHHMLNYKGTTAKLSDFRGKAVVLDFFATWCGACIGALPRLDRLQNQFKDALQVLVVDYEPEQKTRPFLDKNNIGKAVSLPFITSDSILVKFFPHKLIPHEVWIDKDGRVAAITGSGYVNVKNINKLIAGGPLNLPVKKDVMNFDRDKPLLENGNGGNRNDILFRSTLIRHLGIFTGGGSSINKDSTHRRTYFTNSGILSLYDLALTYGSGLKYSLGNRIILYVKDSSKYIDDGSNKAWYTQNTYCYELIAPIDVSRERMYHYMLQDLNQYFGLNGRMEKRLVKCWALVQIKENNSLFKSRGGKLIDSENNDHTERILQNVPIATLLEVINFQYIDWPINPIIVDETSYSGNVDIKLKVQDIFKVKGTRSIPALRKDLRPYGLDLIPIKRRLNMFVLSEVKNCRALAD